MTSNADRITACSSKVGPSEDVVTISGKTSSYVAEMPLSHTIRISPGGEHTYLVGPRRFNMKQLEGEKWVTRSDDYTARMGSSPVQSPKLRLACADVNDVLITNVQYHLRITYHVFLYEPLTPP